MLAKIARLLIWLANKPFKAALLHGKSLGHTQFCRPGRHILVQCLDLIIRQALEAGGELSAFKCLRLRLRRVLALAFLLIGLFRKVIRVAAVGFAICGIVANLQRIGLWYTQPPRGNWHNSLFPNRKGTGQSALPIYTFTRIF